MLTSGQCELAAFMTDGGIICKGCAINRGLADRDDVYDEMLVDFETKMDRDATWSERRQIEDEARELIDQAEEKHGLRPLIQYELDSYELEPGEDLTCDECGDVLVEGEPLEEEEDDDTEYTDEARAQDEWSAKEEAKTPDEFFHD